MTSNEPNTYNLATSSLSPDEFFPDPDPSLDHIDPAILTSHRGDENPAVSDVECGYFNHLYFAAGAIQESFTMTGICPIFYLAPVTKELSKAVITGQYPPTRVLRSVTRADHIRPITAGMGNTEYRELALKHFFTFKALAKKPLDAHPGGRITQTRREANRGLLAACISLSMLDRSGSG